MKHILITGSTGFIGKNLIAALSTSPNYTLLTPERNISEDELREMALKADTIVNLAGVSRTEDPSMFYEGNASLIKKIVETLEEAGKKTPVIYMSSIHAVLDNDFGKSKREGEQAVLEYSKNTGAKSYVIRLTNTFGRWARPNAHSVIATFCYNAHNAIPLVVNDRSKELVLAYIDDLTYSIQEIIDEKSLGFLEEKEDGFLGMKKVYTKNLGELADTIMDFAENKHISENADEFTLRLYTTYTSYSS